MEQTQNVITNVSLFSFLAIFVGLIFFACIYCSVIERRARKQNYYDKTHYVEFWYRFDIFDKDRRLSYKIACNQTKISEKILALQAKQNCIPIEQYLYDDYTKQIEDLRQEYFEVEEEKIELKQSLIEQEEYMKTIPRPKNYFSED